ncbi:MAG: protoglobin domain-containing protein [Burkholderiaceae bacterium]
MQRVHWNGMFEAHIDEAWFASRKHVGAVHANIDLPNDIYFAGMSAFRRLRARTRERCSRRASRPIAENQPR